MSLKYRVLYDDYPQYHNTHPGMRVFILPLLALLLIALFLSLPHIDVDAIEVILSEENINSIGTFCLFREALDRGEVLLDEMQEFCKSFFYAR